MVIMERTLHDVRPGDKVILVLGNEHRSVTTIHRVTSKHVTTLGLDGTETRHHKDSGVMVGDRGSWDLRPRLVPASDEAIAHLERARRVNAAMTFLEDQMQKGGARQRFGDEAILKAADILREAARARAL